MKQFISKSRAYSFLLAVLALLGMAPLAHADTLPLDVSTASTTIAGYVPTAAGLGLVIAVAIMGVTIIWKVFSHVGKKG